MREISKTFHTRGGKSIEPPGSEPEEEHANDKRGPSTPSPTLYGKSWNNVQTPPCGYAKLALPGQEKLMHFKLDKETSDANTILIHHLHPLRRGLVESSGTRAPR